MIPTETGQGKPRKRPNFTLKKQVLDRGSQPLCASDRDGLEHALAGLILSNYVRLLGVEVLRK
jgi:hypothetical protein